MFCRLLAVETLPRPPGGANRHSMKHKSGNAGMKYAIPSASIGRGSGAPVKLISIRQINLKKEISVVSVQVYVIDKVLNTIVIF